MFSIFNFNFYLRSSGDDRLWLIHHSKEFTGLSSFRDTTWNYKTRTDDRYIPHCFPSNKALNAILKNKTLINQSGIPLTDVEKEALSLGLNFVPTIPVVDGSDERIANKAIREWKRKINIGLFLVHPSHYRPDSYFGWLSKEIPSKWEAIEQTWRSNPDANPVPLVTTNPDAPVATPPAILEALSDLSARDDIYILQADKGGAVVLWLAEDYKREALRQLTDRTTYFPLIPKRLFESCRKT